MMNKSVLLNPDGNLLPEIVQSLKDARKTKPIWAKLIEVAREVETLEGAMQANPGDYLCRGISAEQWPQKEKKLLEKYIASGEFDKDDWQRFDPKLDSEAVEAAQIDRPFIIKASWGELAGKDGDYVVRSKTDPADVWLVDRVIFEQSYEFASTPAQFASPRNAGSLVNSDSVQISQTNHPSRPFKHVLLGTLRKWWRSISKNSAKLILCLAIFAFGFTFLGVSNADDTKGVFNWFTDKLYESAQIIFLNMEPHRSDFNWCIGIARLSAVLLVALVAIKAIGRLFKDSWDSLRLRIRGKRNVFIGGLGRIGYQLATDYSAQGKLVVAQEIVDADYWIQSAEDIGIIVIKGDVTDVNSMRDHMARDPETIHLVTGNDLANINALANVKSIRREFQTSGNSLGPTTCYVHIDDSGLQQTLNRCLIESTYEEDNTLDVQVFNIYHETAVQLIIDRLTPLRPTVRDEVALYIVFGFEQMGIAMVKELAEYAHFENQKRSRILVLTPNATEACEKCLEQWCRLSPHQVFSNLSDLSFDPVCDEWTSQIARPRIDEHVEPSPTAIEYCANEVL
ncbi:MAG: NAD-binding protein [Pirellulales bacterium]